MTKQIFCILDDGTVFYVDKIDWGPEPPDTNEPPDKGLMDRVMTPPKDDDEAQYDI
jgi:hypothetical protein